MNEPLNSIIHEIDNKFIYATIDFKNYTWRKDIPLEAEYMSHAFWSKH